jgi:hypothetical protein
LDALVDHDPARVAVLVLVPKARKLHVEQHLQQQVASERAWVITWEEVRDDLQHVKNEDAPPVAMVAAWLLEYLAPCLQSMEIAGTPACYIGRGPLVGNAYQYDLLYKLKSCLNSPGRITSRPTYVGFSCAATSRDEDEKPAAPAWVGFANTPEGEIVFGVDSYLLAGPNDFSMWNKRFIPVELSAGEATVIELGRRVQSVLDGVQTQFDQLHRSGPQAEASAGTTC